MNKNLIAFSATLLLLIIFVRFVALKLANPSFLILILTILAAATWLVYLFMLRTKQEDFVKNYLLTIVLKLLGGGIFIFALIFFDKDGAEANAVLFMTAYFLFTGLEVGFLFRRLK